MADATGKPRFEIRYAKSGASKGSPYFVLIDSQGKVKKESNVYYMGTMEERKHFATVGAEDDLERLVKAGKIK